MKISLIFLITIISINISFSQDSIISILDFTLNYRGLTRDDITIPINFDKDKSPTNDSKLLLPVVRDIMKDPLRSFGFMDSISKLSFLSSDSITYSLVKLMFPDSEFPKKMNFYKSIFIFTSFPTKAEELNVALIDFVKRKQSFSKLFQKTLSKDEFTFISKNLLSIISESDSENGDNSDIFKFNKARDSSMAISRKTLDILSKLNTKAFTDSLITEFYYTKVFYLGMIREINNSIFDNSNEEEIFNDHIQGDFLYYYNEDGIRIAIGGKEKNIYTGHFDFIIDLGGDDVYNIDRGSKDLFKNNFSCIIDLSGNDYYSTNSDYCLAGTAFSSGFIFDKEGDDTYKGKNVSLGSAICGLGVLYDENGNDTYHANQFSIGAASFGIGLLVDRNGNDVYIANSYSQGFGMTEGVGAIVDIKGNDSYLIDARSLDIGRYEDHYISMSQGYGLGLRPYYAGGIGLIIEGEGNDFYSTDIFGQGGAYWYGLGCIADKSGNDKYNSYQYAQGAGIHLAVGLLKDYDGWDLYSSNGVSQGCGHDLGFGLLFDVKGNDNYSAYSLSQGAGNANGIGILIDESGRDGYLNKEPGNTRGYGNSRREFGSLGVFLDASGDDFYSSQKDSMISNSSMWGVMNDYYLKDQTSQPSGSNYKVALDSNKNYTLEENFVMAKTIEPRFSLWQEYGFRKLVEDSMKTSEYILKYLETNDHRASLVLRNLAFRIGYTMGNLFVEKLRRHLSSMSAASVFNENQLAFICYLFGETRNPIGREELLNLTHDESIRVRSSAVNALGKIKIDTNETDFMIKGSERLRQLAAEQSPFKMFNKDIAYAFKNYKSESNIPVLIDMMNYNYFGVRFNAADALKEFGDEYYKNIDNNVLYAISSERKWYQSFLNSLENISDENFRNLFDKLLQLEISKDNVINLGYINLLMNKKEKSVDNEFKDWADSLINILKSESKLRVE